MYKLGSNDVRILVPTRFVECYETDPIARSVFGKDFRIDVEIVLGGNIYMCDLDTGTPLEEFIAILKPAAYHLTQRSPVMRLAGKSL